MVAQWCSFWFQVPLSGHHPQKGYPCYDIQGYIARTQRGVRSMCLPNGWSAPTIDAEGTVFVGNEEGNFYALRDMDGDGVVFGLEEVVQYDTKSSFSGSSSPAVAPDLLAVASCDTLFVFKG